MRSGRGISVIRTVDEIVTVARLHRDVGFDSVDRLARRADKTAGRRAPRAVFPGRMTNLADLIAR